MIEPALKELKQWTTPTRLSAARLLHTLLVRFLLHIRIWKTRFSVKLEFSVIFGNKLEEICHRETEIKSITGKPPRSLFLKLLKCCELNILDSDMCTLQISTKSCM